jgi:hypothetical protein
MNRAMIQKASALARGTRRIPLVLDEPDLEAAAGEADDADAIIDAEFVDVPADAPVEALLVTGPPRVTPGRARRATDAYVAAPTETRPIIAIG